MTSPSECYPEEVRQVGVDCVVSVLGEVEPCSLDAYGPLDKIAKTTKKEESHGS